MFGSYTAPIPNKRNVVFYSHLTAFQRISQPLHPELGPNFNTTTTTTSQFTPSQYRHISHSPHPPGPSNRASRFVVPCSWRCCQPCSSNLVDSLGRTQPAGLDSKNITPCNDSVPPIFTKYTLNSSGPLPCVAATITSMACTRPRPRPRPQPQSHETVHKIHAVLVWCGGVWCGGVWCGGVWCGVVWFGLEWAI
ncbi:hypothetical protein BD289DRAFT_162130 [Coniella lustricola]|uniref:Uncharacterized protein n=1 Tax=Coniella lustricola TaxID=2025994 RepID=A0A2T2ZUB2_9PEZI|nr:hypothetical protein BD289DRAFT_162130 [Coniella lustricola]